MRDVQRERGEIAIEGVGTLELSAAEREPLHRIDVRELNRALQSLARLPLLSAFRYQRAAGANPTLAFDVKRFADAGVLAAVADRAVATTLVTSEGRALTEVILTVQNRAQPFLKVSLPQGATMVSVDVAGQPAKPVLGTDGTRVPLLRPGFRPNGPYHVSFVYLHAGTPFDKKGDIEMTLPRMDMPVGIVEWELFAPERYSIKSIGGNAIETNMMRVSDGSDRKESRRSYSGPTGRVSEEIADGGAARSDQRRCERYIRCRAARRDDRGDVSGTHRRRPDHDDRRQAGVSCSPTCQRAVCPSQPHSQDSRSHAMTSPSISVRAS